MARIHQDHCEPDGQTIKVQLQDNNSELISVKLCRKLADIKLSSDTAIDQYVINLVAGHGVEAGNIICLRQDSRYYQGVAVSVNVNAISLNEPLDYAFTTIANAYRSSDNMNVDGSSAPVIFSAVPPPNTAWDIQQIILSIVDGTAMDDGKFGGISELPRGVVLRKKNGTYKNALYARSNGEFSVKGAKIQYNDRAGGTGVYGITVYTDMKDVFGTVIRVDADESDEIQLIVQDDLTELSSFLAVVCGHRVT